MGDTLSRRVPASGFPGNSMFKTVHFKAGVLGLSPGQRTKIPCAAQGNLKI